jgi:hypothetical protein
MTITRLDLLDEKHIALNLLPGDQSAALREIVHLVAGNGGRGQRPGARLNLAVQGTSSAATNASRIFLQQPIACAIKNFSLVRR